MKSKSLLMIFLLIFISSLQLGMARRQGQYDEEARQAEREEKARMKVEKKTRKNPAKNFAEGVKEVAVDTPTEFVGDTTQATLHDPPVVGTLGAAAEGSGKALDTTVRGASKVATLGFGEVNNYEIQEPEQGTDDTTKIRIKIPGT